MAKPEHLSLLTRSVANWNQWRRDNTDIQPDLVKADLRGADLTEARLARANLRGADLTGATLVKADLREADLTETRLAKANLRGADFTGTTLVKATIREADLTETKLNEAHLRWAHLRGAHLTRATLVKADLREADLTEARLDEVHLRWADLRGADLSRAHLSEADLSGADLGKAHLHGAHLRGANLRWADLRETDLRRADLTEADLTEANLAGATLEQSSLVNTTCTRANFTGCRIYGISAWDLRLEEAQQTNLIITPPEEPDITVDNLEVAQFIYLLLNNPRIRDVIDTITSKVVLILGRFTPERKEVLDAIRERLRTKNYSPVVFDFEKPITRDLTETVMTLAGMAKFVIADLTDPKCIPHELMSFVPNLPSVPVLPLLHTSQKQEYAMFQDLQRRCHWVMETVRYEDQETLLRSLELTVILPAELKAKELIATQRK